MPKLGREDRCHLLPALQLSLGVSHGMLCSVEQVFGNLASLRRASRASREGRSQTLCLPALRLLTGGLHAFYWAREGTLPPPQLSALWLFSSHCSSLWTGMPHRGPPVFWDQVPPGGRVSQEPASPPLRPWQLFSLQQLSLTWILTSEKQPPHGQPGRLQSLPFRNAPIHHMLSPAKHRQAVQVTSQQAVLSRTHRRCHHAEQGSSFHVFSLMFIIQFNKYLSSATL